MAEEFRVSVITPVYNAAEFVARAVESALAQPETGEVLLIEDNSPDDSLRVCRELAEKHEKVRLLRHPDGGNHGAGASRNLGMQNARFEFIAFLDADDYYLPDRFFICRKVFAKHADCEGVYETVIVNIENSDGEKRWIASRSDPNEKVITIRKYSRPQDFGISLLKGNGGIHLDGFTIKKYILTKAGLMSETLRLHQDTEFFIRCALSASLYPGEIDRPVAFVNVHDHNRFFAPRSQSLEYKNRMAYWMSLYHWVKENSSTDMVKEIRSAIIKYTRTHKYFRNFPRELFPTRLIWLVRLLRLVIYPETLLDIIRSLSSNIVRAARK